MEGRRDQANQAVRGGGASAAGAGGASPQGDQAVADHRSAKNNGGARGQGAYYSIDRTTKQKTKTRPERQARFWGGKKLEIRNRAQIGAKKF